MLKRGFVVVFWVLCNRLTNCIFITVSVVVYKYQKFVLRDILHYTDEEINDLSLLDYNLALNYSLETYVRRDVMGIMSSGKKEDPKGTFSYTIKHTGIELYIKESYEEK